MIACVKYRVFRDRFSDDVFDLLKYKSPRRCLVSVIRVFGTASGII